MLNPFAPQQDPNRYPFIDARKKILQDMKAAGVEDQVFEVVQKAYEEALRKDNIVILMPRSLKKRLLAQVMKQVLAHMASRLNETSQA